ncbi:MAG: histidine phosphatase family protein [Planctomycetota bacterium]
MHRVGSEATLVASRSAVSELGRWRKTIARQAWTNLLLIRAAPTEWDVEGRLGSGVTLPLSEVHEAEVAQAIARLDGTELRSLFVAPDACSRAVASLVTDSTGVKAKEVADLAEVDLGLWDGSLLADIAERHPTAVKQWRDDVYSVTPPNGEPAAAARARLCEGIWRTLAKLVDTDPGIGIVLRPLAFDVFRSFLKREPCGFGPGEQGTCIHEWVEIETARLKAERSRIGA